ncbi:MAG: TerB family tellurite resistance protein [Rhizobiales bacterium]|nr:TerB family tellurite resistance protein [Hyphomicrobiales bacterium]
MLDTIKAFFAELTGECDQSRFQDGDYRVAATALLVHALNIDGNVTARENAKLHSLLRQRFQLDADATEELIRAATVIEGEAVDLYHFTSLLNRTLDEEGRRRIIEMMWELIYADGRVNEFEDNLVWRVADLLGVSSRERLLLRQKVASQTDVDPHLPDESVTLPGRA